jgi:AraC-like DNA-binding protein
LDELALLWRLAEERSDDSFLGLHAAEWVDPVVNHVHAQLILSSRNLREGLLAAWRTNPVFAHGAETRMEERNDSFAVCYKHARGDLPPGRHAVEFSAVVLRGIWGFAHDSPLPLLGVEFEHPLTGDHSEHERVLGCPVDFARPVNALVVAREVMLRPSRHYSAELSRRLQEVAEMHLARLSQPSFSAELRAILRSRLQRNACDADSIAAELHMSLRTLQRRLEVDGTSFSEQLDSVKQEVALGLIEGDLPVREIAERCGFSGSRALIRAFRRWTGTTPLAYREQLCSKAGRPSV